MRRLCVLILSLLMCGEMRVQAAGLGASDPSVLIGAVVTLTGPNALAGQDMVDGFNLALRQLGGRFTNQEVRLLLADDRGSPDIALQQVKKLLERERLDVVLTGTSPAAMAQIIKPLIKSQLFVLSLDQPAPDMAGRSCGPWVFSLAPHPDGQHEALGNHLTQEKKRRIVVVQPDSPLTAEMIAALRHSFHGEVLIAPLPKPGAMNFQPQLEMIAASHPDAVYSLLTGGMGVSFVRAWAAAEGHDDVPLYVTWQALERQNLPALGDAALDVLSIGMWSPDLDNPATKRLDVEFESEYGRYPTTWAAQGYDAAMLLDSALKTTLGRTLDAEAVRAALRRAEFTSTRGTFKYNTNQFPMMNYHLRRVVRDAKGRLTFELKSTVLRDWRDPHANACAARWAEEAALAAPPPGPAGAPGGAVVKPPKPVAAAPIVAPTRPAVPPANPIALPAQPGVVPPGQ